MIPTWIFTSTLWTCGGYIPQLVLQERALDSTNGSKKGCGITIDPLKHQLLPASSVQWFLLANDLMPLYNPKLIIGLQPERFTEDVGHPLPLLQISYVFQREALPQELMLKNVSSLDPIKATKEMLHWAIQQTLLNFNAQLRQNFVSICSDVLRFFHILLQLVSHCCFCPDLLGFSHNSLCSSNICSIVHIKDMEEILWVLWHPAINHLLERIHQEVHDNWPRWITLWYSMWYHNWGWSNCFVMNNPPLHITPLPYLDGRSWLYVLEDVISVGNWCYNIDNWCYNISYNFSNFRNSTGDVAMCSYVDSILRKYTCWT